VRIALVNGHRHASRITHHASRITAFLMAQLVR